MKRGLTEATMIGLILAIAGGLVLASVTGILITRGGEKVNLDLCRSNVQVAATSGQLLQVTKCHTKPLGELAVSDPKKYKEELSQQIARTTYECNYQFGETKNLPWKGDFFTTSTVCFVCSTFKLPEKGAPLATSDLTAWMKTHNTPQTSSYLEYITKRLPLEDQRNLVVESFGNEVTYTPPIITSGPYVPPPKTEFRIYPAEQLIAGKQYATISYGAPKGRFSQIYAAFSGEAATTVPLGKDGEEINSIFITNFDAISKNCDITFVRYP